ncbi:ABC transporter substrate-binding protein [Siccirubricoccus sp. KC 17139]|uniref:ABC transporter substrate-binding protein n=1 Tax=Siccirubricoccus soli TaxID=2899147 RepID=A0ABT1D8S5_9PROT|nr:ABC transporter substrate-binding protein [Siccirubricoccus soli]MCO6418340.1 ABC transporter substrate-binding protein [Siccirubricoccus soli]MCP2684475.1 ABC transporter substrate-binding protein [Siccirubricoccus soli]
MRRSQAFGLVLGAALAAAPMARAQELTIAVGGAFTSMDPHFFDLSPNHALTWHVFDRLLHPDPDQRPSPGLAESWRALDERTWEFKLRQGVTFQDGTPFTADDVVFTFARAPNVPNSPTSLGQYIRPVQRLEVVDAHTIRLHTAEPIPLIPQMMMAFSVIGRKQGEGMSTADYNSGRAAVGTGPYRLVSFTLGDRAVFERNPRWWGPAQPWQRVTYRLITNDSARVAALQSGDVDAIDAVPTRDVARLQRDARLNLAHRPGLRLIYLYVDASRPQTPHVMDRNGQPLASNPLRDVRVRRALSMAVNREGIRRQIMEGFSLPTGQAQPEGAMGYDPSIPVPAYDPDGAKKLLAEAGFPEGFNITLHGPNDRYVNDDAIAQAIAQMWTRIGVRTQVQTSPASVFFTAGGVRDEHSVALTGWSTSTGEPDTHLSLMLATPDPQRGRGTRLRPSHYSNPELDRMIDRALTTIDTEAREKAYHDIIRIGYQRDLAVIPIHHQVNIWAMKRSLTYRPTLSEQTRAMEFAPAR